MGRRAVTDGRGDFNHTNSAGSSSSSGCSSGTASSLPESQEYTVQQQIGLLPASPQQPSHHALSHTKSSVVHHTVHHLPSHLIQQATLSHHQLRPYSHNQHGAALHSLQHQHLYSLQNHGSLVGADLLPHPHYSTATAGTAGSATNSSTGPLPDSHLANAFVAASQLAAQQAAVAAALHHEMALVSHPTASGQMFVQQEAKKSSQRGIPVAAQALPALPQQATVSHIASQAILAAAQQPFYHAPSLPQDAQPDRPIGYGAFGVVWSVTDPRTGKRLALKKMPNVFQNLASCKRVFREIKLLASFKHENVLCLADIIQPQSPSFFQELYVLTELMQSDLHKIIVSPQTLTVDHVKVFLYQILRGVKYLHSANILHRDIKPGNLLVNSNCCLKICDFGLARIWDSRERISMTHEVVTQYYRAPELLMGARKYTDTVDIWSVGCIFAELLGRRILYQASGPIEQLNQIIQMLGTPSENCLRYACDGAKSHVLRLPKHNPDVFQNFMKISQLVTDQAARLLMKMLEFDPERRIKVDDALTHSYIWDGRMRYHSCMCNCCSITPSGQREYTRDFEPNHEEPFDPRWERDLTRCSMFDLRDKLYNFVVERHSQMAREQNHVPLVINPKSAAYQNFTNSSVAQPSELPPSPNQWEC